jgi:hypothetical protein
MDDTRRREMHTPANYKFGGQAVVNSYQHGMRAPRQSVADAKAKKEEFVAENKNKATEYQCSYENQGGKGLSDLALYSFGIAAHTVSDETSPAHTNRRGDPIVWLPTAANVLLRVAQEIEITPEQVQINVARLQEAFKSVFGAEAASKATSSPAPEQQPAPARRKPPE